MNRQTKVRATTLLLILAAIVATACEPPHTIKATKSNGTTYKAQHIVTGTGKSDDEHVFWPETSPLEVEFYEADAATFITKKGWTPNQIKRTSPATRQHNCHGLTLDDGRTWINGEFAEDIARYYGYKDISQCSPNTPQPDDIVVYRDANGIVRHTGKVISVSGGTVKVHSKWGSGPDYEHDVQVVPPEYGTPSYFRRC